MDPLTGKLIPTADTLAVALTISSLREHRRQVDDAIAAFSQAVIEESHRLGTRTLNLGATTVEVTADSEIEWDVTELNKLLAVGLPDDRYNQLVQTVVSDKIDGRVAKQLEGASGKYKAIIERAKRGPPSGST